MAYPQPSQNRYISSVDRNNMLRYPYNTDLYSVRPQNSEPLSENHLQFGHINRLFHPVGLPRGSNLIDQNSSSPVNVFNVKVNRLTKSLHQTNLVIEKNELTKKMQFSQTERETLVQNFTITSFASDNNHMRLLETFNKNFHLLRPGVLDVVDQRRKILASDEEAVVQNSLSLLDAKGNKRKKPKLEAQNGTNRCVNISNAMKKNEAQARSKIAIQEDENGFLTVCYEPLLETNGLRKVTTSSGLIGEIDTKAASLVNKDDEPDSLDLTLHL